MYFVCTKYLQMQNTKTHTVVTRGISKADKNKLKRLAAKKRLSVNQLMLSVVDDFLANNKEVVV